MIIALSAVAVFAVGGIGYALTKDSSDTSETTQTTQSSTKPQASSQNSDESSTQETSMTNDEPLPQTGSVDESEYDAGTYQEYNADIVAGTAGTRLLFFHAPWCPQCRDLESSILSGTIPENTTIFKVDYDTNQSLRQTYGVTQQTTVVKLKADGSLGQKYVAYDDPTLRSVIANLL